MGIHQGACGHVSRSAWTVRSVRSARATGACWGTLALVLLAGTSGALAQPGTSTIGEMDKSVVREPEKAIKPVEVPAATAPGEPAVLASDRALYPISGFEFSYAPQSRALSNLPMLADVLAGAVAQLERMPDGTITGKGFGGEPVPARLSEFSAATPLMFDIKGLEAVSLAVRDEMVRRGVLGNVTGIVASDIGPDQADLRGGRTTMRFVTLVASVSEVRTLAAGDRVVPTQRADGTLDYSARINNQKHAWIRENGPAKIGGYLDRNELDNYALFLGRQPGRRVDVGVGPGAGAGGQLTLDYLVAESKPWLVLFQLSNTGTKQTNEWRERFGFQQNQLTGNDDVLKIDYLTAGFEDTNAILGSYEFPLFGDSLERRLRMRTFGSFSTYEASDVGAGGQQFSGDNWNLGAELIWNVYQNQDLFVDVIGGGRWESVKTENKTQQTEGDSDFFLLKGGVALERGNEKWATQLTADITANLPGVAGTGELDELVPLGRFNPDREFQIASVRGSQSFFLEPLLAPSAFAGKGLKAGEQWQPGMTLAHEVVFMGGFTTSLGQRLVPNFQEVVGGFFTVRGYPENYVAGDRVYSGTAEYRVHLPRLFGIDPSPGKMPVFGTPNFRSRPQEAFGSTDWDLVFRGFIDAARVESQERFAFEQNATLVGAGVGVEWSVLRYFNLRVDVGVPLRSTNINNERVEGGSDARLHLLLTLSY